MNRFFTLFFILLFVYVAESRETSFWFFGGVSLPEEQTSRLNQDGIFYLTDSARTQGKLNYPDSKAGYSLGIKLGMELAERVDFYGGFAFTKYPKSRLMLMKTEDGNDTLSIFNVQHTIIPITAGLKYYLSHSFADFYADVALSYNFVTFAVDYEKYNPDLPISANISESRLGFIAGLGLEFSLDVFTPFIEVNYSRFNFINRSSNEPERNSVNILLGFRF